MTDTLSPGELTKIPLDIIERDGFPRFDLDRVYYLSGPMSGYPEYNFRAFTEAAAILRNHHITVESPHEIDHGETDENRGKLPYESYMQAALDLLYRCNGIILLPGWPQSTGARRELSLALELNMPVYFYHWPIEYQDPAEIVCMNQTPPA